MSKPDVLERLRNPTRWRDLDILEYNAMRAFADSEITSLRAEVARLTLLPDEAENELFQIREWLSFQLNTSVRHFGESDRSGHPHGYAGVVIPDWDVKQKLGEIGLVLSGKSRTLTEENADLARALENIVGAIKDFEITETLIPAINKEARSTLARHRERVKSRGSAGK